MRALRSQASMSAFLISGAGPVLDVGGVWGLCALKLGCWLSLSLLPVFEEESGGVWGRSADEREL